MANLGAIYGYRLHFQNTLAGNNIPLGSVVGGKKAEEIKYANTVFMEIKAQKAEPAMDSRAISEALPSREEIESYVRQVFGEGNATWALCVCDCESGYNTLATNPTGLYYGLFQFLPSTYNYYSGKDFWQSSWRDHVDVAKIMFDMGLQHHWPVCNRACTFN